ncbi:hypothetical protein FOA52_005619 [Chlamydomonas sp. UWO 241]|nr:hypothetical protein FOA52_005619 [Chlamydomonas sp. UWO 241]
MAEAFSARDSRRPSESSVKETQYLVVDQVKDNVFVNQYLVIKDLGKGAHGRVKLVYNTEDDLLYAMKVIVSRKSRRTVTAERESASPSLSKSAQLQVLRTLSSKSQGDKPRRESMDRPHLHRVHRASLSTTSSLQQPGVAECRRVSESVGESQRPTSLVSSPMFASGARGRSSSPSLPASAHVATSISAGPSRSRLGIFGGVDDTSQAMYARPSAPLPAPSATPSPQAPRSPLPPQAPRSSLPPPTAPASAVGSSALQLPDAAINASDPFSRISENSEMLSGTLTTEHLTGRISSSRSRGRAMNTVLGQLQERGGAHAPSVPVGSAFASPAAADAAAAASGGARGSGGAHSAAHGAAHGGALPPLAPPLAHMIVPSSESGSGRGGALGLGALGGGFSGGLGVTLAPARTTSSSFTWAEGPAEGGSAGRLSNTSTTSPPSHQNGAAGGGGGSNAFRVQSTRGSRKQAIHNSGGLTALEVEVRKDPAELAVMKGLDNPYVVKLYEAIVQDGKLIMVMEYVEGGCVMEGMFATTKVPISEAVALQYFRDVVQGLDYLHFNGVVHGDVKPDNLLLTISAKVKITDFGSARLCAVGDKLATPTGTPAFMAPEQCTGRPFDGFAGDMWALGVCLYMFVFGTPPFSGHTSYQVYHAIQNQTLALPPAKPVSPDLERLLRALLNKTPGERATMESVLEHPWVTSRGRHPILSSREAAIEKMCEALLLDDSQVPFERKDSAVAVPLPSTGPRTLMSIANSSIGRRTGGPSPANAMSSSLRQHAPCSSLPGHVSADAMSILGETDSEALRQLMPGAVEQVFDDGQVLVCKGAPCAGLFLVLDGSCDVLRPRRERKLVPDDDFADDLGNEGGATSTSSSGGDNDDGDGGKGEEAADEADVFDGDSGGGHALGRNVIVSGRNAAGGGISVRCRRSQMLSDSDDEEDLLSKHLGPEDNPEMSMAISEFMREGTVSHIAPEYMVNESAIGDMSPIVPGSANERERHTHFGWSEHGGGGAPLRNVGSATEHSMSGIDMIEEGEESRLLEVDREEAIVLEYVKVGGSGDEEYEDKHNGPAMRLVATGAGGAAGLAAFTRGESSLRPSSYPQQRPAAAYHVPPHSLDLDARRRSGVESSFSGPLATRPAQAPGDHRAANNAGSLRYAPRVSRSNGRALSNNGVNDCTVSTPLPDLPRGLGAPSPPPEPAVDAASAAGAAPPQGYRWGGATMSASVPGSGSAGTFSGFCGGPGGGGRGGGGGGGSGGGGGGSGFSGFGALSMMPKATSSRSTGATIARTPSASRLRPNSQQNNLQLHGGGSALGRMHQTIVSEPLMMLQLFLTGDRESGAFGSLGGSDRPGTEAPQRPRRELSRELVGRQGGTPKLSNQRMMRTIERSVSMQGRMLALVERAKTAARQHKHEGSAGVLCHRGPGALIGTVSAHAHSDITVVARGTVRALLITQELVTRHGDNPLVRVALTRSANALLVQEALERFVECEKNVRMDRRIRNAAARLWFDTAVLEGDEPPAEEDDRKVSFCNGVPLHDAMAGTGAVAAYARP